METKAENSASRFDVIKWVLVAALIGVGVVGNSYYAEESLLYRVLALLELAVIAGAIALQTYQGAAFWNLVKESRTEIRTVVLPTRQ